MMAPHVGRKVILILFLFSSVLGSSLESIAQQNFEENFKREFASQLELIENQNVGCLYDKDVCPIEDNCMDDGLFGTCIAQYSDMTKFTYRLPPELQRDLRTILSNLLERNYTWHDRYTQCCVRAALICGSMEIPTDLTVCRNFEKVERLSSASVPDVTFFDRLAKRLELLQRKKYEYELDIPEKRREAEAEAAAAVAEAERILDKWQARRQQHEDQFLKLMKAVMMKQETEAQLDEALPVTKTSSDEEEPRSDEDSQLPRELLQPGTLPRPIESELTKTNYLTPEIIDEAVSTTGDTENDDSARRFKDKPAPAPSPPPSRRHHHAGPQVKQPKPRVRMHRLLLREQLNKRQADPAFIDGSYLWVRFDKTSSLKESDISGFISRLNRLSGHPILCDDCSVNITNGEVYFQLTPQAHISEIQSIFENKTTELTTNGKMKWTSYGFGKPQNRVEASELVTDAGQQARITSTLLVCGLVLLMIAALFVVFLVQRVRSSKWRLRDFVAPSGPGGDSDYRDLCRQRMTQKSGEQREPVSAAAQQIGAAKPGAGSPNSSTGSWTDDPITTDMDITTGHLILTYMEDYLSNKEKLEQEWAGLCSYEADQSSSAAAAQPENAAKNRYPDLLPYDHSRVILRKDQNATGSDYINASSISDSDPKVKAYILTQGPSDDTANDFWQMVWECGAATIVNLTGQMSADGNHELCAQYWPSEGSRLFNRFEVHLVSEHIWCEDFVVRNFYLKNLANGEARTVTMFHFLTWAEDELPPSAKSLLDFRRKVNKSYKGRSSPLVIHCNDGCGRTGTYCLLDLALNRINKGVKEIDLAASLEHLRDQRAGLVKTEDQFEFVITAIAEEVHNVLKTLPQ